MSAENSSCCAKLKSSSSGILLLTVVFLAVFIDKMLQTCIAPILPDLLDEIDHRHQDDSSNVRSEPQHDCRNFTLIRYPTTYYPYWRIHKNRTSPNVLHTCRNVTKHNSCLCSQIKQNMSRSTEERNRDSKAEDEISNKDFIMGLMLASKAIVQIISNGFVGPLTNRVGYSVPMLSGFAITCLSTLLFAFGKTYWVLFLARAIQGFGSSCCSVSAFGVLAAHYTDDAARARAMTLALSGQTIGFICGPTFGGTLYEFLGQPAPFLILAGLALIAGGLQLTTLKPVVKAETKNGAPILTLLRDPYVLLGAGTLFLGTTGHGVMEVGLPTWVADQMNASNWQQGVIFLPPMLGFLLGANLCGLLITPLGRWLWAAVGCWICVFSYIAVPFGKSLIVLAVPVGTYGVGVGLIEVSIMPVMGHIVDVRHIPVYGSVYAIADSAFALGMAIGPTVGGIVVDVAGFNWSLWILAIVQFVFAPSLLFLRKIHPRADNEETQPLTSAEPSPGSEHGGLRDEGTSKETASSAQVEPKQICIHIPDTGIPKDLVICYQNDH